MKNLGIVLFLIQLGSTAVAEKRHPVGFNGKRPDGNSVRTETYMPGTGDEFFD